MKNNKGLQFVTLACKDLPVWTAVSVFNNAILANRTLTDRTIW